MPIAKASKMMIEFGLGDIAVGGALIFDKELGKKLGVVTFEEVEPNEIGETVACERRNIDEYPLTFVFQKTESIDVVIEKLRKAKKMMEKENGKCTNSSSHLD